LAIYRDRADNFVFLEQRYGDQAPRVRELDCGNAHFVFESRLAFDIGDVQQPLSFEDSAKTAFRVRMNHRFAIKMLAICRRRAMRGGDAEGTTFSEPQITELGLA
jgi:hypothetical protein